MGFHDGTAINRRNGDILILDVDELRRPPVKQDIARVCVASWSGKVKSIVDETTTWNFPQGARQQWIEDGKIIHNRRLGGDCVSVVTTLESGEEVVLNKPVYVVDHRRKIGFGLNFARLHRLGGYGYVGLSDRTCRDNSPTDDGIWEIDLATGKTGLLVSIDDTVRCSGSHKPSAGVEHYLTHVVPSPDSNRLAFLHRHWLADGGIHTRLIVCRHDGTQLECWAEGFLSHFDWLDRESILIWGRPFARLQAARGHPLLCLPLVRQLASFSRPLLRRLFNGRGAMSANYLVVRAPDATNGVFGKDVFTEDGHPTLRPTDRSLLLTDTYPDQDGWRRLMLSDIANPKVYELGRFRQAQCEPDQSRLAEAVDGIEPDVLKAFSARHFAYSRSGIHCDLHPRWRWDGNAICFDSNHEGYRDVYRIDVAATNPE